MLEIYTQKTLETGNFCIETRLRSLSSWYPYVKASMRRNSASGQTVFRDPAAFAGRRRPEVEPAPRVPGKPRGGDRGSADRGFGPAGGTGCRRKSSFLQRGGPFADTVESSLVEIGRFRGMANRQVGTADVVCSLEGFRIVPSPDPRSRGFGP